MTFLTKLNLGFRIIPPETRIILGGRNGPGQKECGMKRYRECGEGRNAKPESTGQAVAGQDFQE